MNRLSLYTRAAIALAAVAIVVAGCADSRMAANNSSQGEQPYKTSYGFTSDGPTTDLYTELFGPRKTEAAPATATAATQPAAEPVTASTATQPAQPAATQQTKPPTASAANRQAQPAPAPPPVQVAQQPAAPQTPPEPDPPTMYGITANGPTTDLFTELFGPRRPSGQ